MWERACVICVGIYVYTCRYICIHICAHIDGCGYTHTERVHTLKDHSARPVYHPITDGNRQGYSCAQRHSATEMVVSSPTLGTSHRRRWAVFTNGSGGTASLGGSHLPPLRQSPRPRATDRRGHSPETLMKMKSKNGPVLPPECGGGPQSRTTP